MYNQECLLGKGNEVCLSVPAQSPCRKKLHGGPYLRQTEKDRKWLLLVDGNGVLWMDALKVLEGDTPKATALDLGYGRELQCVLHEKI